MTPPLVSHSQLSSHVDQRVRVRGRVSRVPWQHMTAVVPGAESKYFDLEDGAQIMVYTRVVIASDALVELTGTVLAVRGAGKRPSPDEPRHTEHSLIVEACTRV